MEVSAVQYPGEMNKIFFFMRGMFVRKHLMTLGFLVRDEK
jgi:hypothetical protein